MTEVIPARPMLVTTYAGYEIVLHGERFQAIVDGELLISESTRELKEKIETLLKQLAVTNRERLSEPVFTNKGESFKITGIHAGNSKVLFSPALSIYSLPTMYADTREARQLFEVWKDKYAEVQAALANLDAYRVPINVASGSHPEQIARLKAAIATAKQGQTKENAR